MIAVVVVMIAVVVAVISESGISKYIVPAAICFSVLMSMFAINGYRKFRTKGVLSCHSRSSIDCSYNYYGNNAVNN